MARPRHATLVFLGLFVATALLLARMLSVFFAAIVLALVLVTLFQPLHGRILRLTGHRPRLAATLTTLLILLGVVVPVAGFVTSLLGEARPLLAAHRDSALLGDVVRLLKGDDPHSRRMVELLDWLGIYGRVDEIATLTSGAVKQVGHFLTVKLSGVATNALVLLAQFAVMMIVVFSLLVHGPRLKAFLMDLSPLPDDEELELIARFQAIARAVFVGNGVSSLLQGLFGGLGFVIFGLGAPVVWGTVMAVLASLPVFGASVVFVPATVILLFSGKPYYVAALFLGYNLLYVGLCEYVLKPRLIGSGGQLNPVLVFLSILGGLAAFGIMGLFYGPLIAAMFMTLVDIYKARYRKPQAYAAEVERADDVSMTG